MEYNYPIIEGKVIGQADLKITRAKNIARVLSDHSFCNNETLRFISQKNGKEVILCQLDIEISQSPKNGIQDYEDVAIVCSADDLVFPEIYALRESFYSGLAHTNAKTFEHPICLCVNEENYREVRHKFNEFEFIQSIFRWFKLTAEGAIHQDDQPLEPFFTSNDYVVLKKGFKIEKDAYLYRPKGSRFYYLTNNSGGDSQLLIMPFQFDAIEHGYVNRVPSKISDLNVGLKVKNTPFNVYVRKYLESNTQRVFRTDNTNNRIAIICIIPVKRNDKDKKPSLWRYLALFTKDSIYDIGIKLGLLTDQDGSFIKDLDLKIKQEIVDGLKIELKTIIFDFDHISAALYNNQERSSDEYTMIGAGSLGSQVYDNLLKVGFGIWTIVDNDILSPHNLAKHTLGRDDIGYNKAERLCARANYLMGESISTPVCSNFLDVYSEKEFSTRLKNSKAIIDMSTSIAVARVIARDFKNDIKAPRISAFLNPLGNDLVFLAEDKGRKHRLDFLEMQYYRNLNYEPKLHSHLQFNQSQRIRYNRNSCRDITNRINQTNVSVLSSIAAKAIQSHSARGKANISIWSIDEETFSVQKFSFTPSRWFRKNVGDWKVYVDLWLIEKMQDFRKSKLPNETGGILLGSYDSERKIIYVCDSLFAPTDSVEGPTSFERGIEGLKDKYERYVNITDHQLLYIGEWHSHPEKCAINPSNYDKKLYKYLYDNMSKQGLPVIMGIIGDSDCNVVFKEPDYEI